MCAFVGAWVRRTNFFFFFFVWMCLLSTTNFILFWNDWAGEKKATTSKMKTSEALAFLTCSRTYVNTDTYMHTKNSLCCCLFAVRCYCCCCWCINKNITKCMNPKAIQKKISITELREYYFIFIHLLWKWLQIGRISISFALVVAACLSCNSQTLAGARGKMI